MNNGLRSFPGTCLGTLVVPAWPNKFFSCYSQDPKDGGDLNEITGAYVCEEREEM